jgi:hypothetical protein
LAARALRLAARRMRPAPAGARNWWQTAEADMFVRVWKWTQSECTGRQRGACLPGGNCRSAGIRNAIGQFIGAMGEPSKFETGARSKTGSTSRS